LETSNLIYVKLEAFIKKFYTNELIRGIIFFVGLGLLYFLFTLFIEYFLWLKPIGRAFLFWIFIAVEVFLLFRFILFPIFKLVKLQKGIDYSQASKIIGNHFTEVGDKLTNFLQLSSDANQSELLMASIEQKANALQPVPFGNAINFKGNKKYLPLAILPLLLFALFYLSGNSTVISQSLNRVVHFKSTFLRPAPFQFVVLNTNLQTEQNKDFILRIKTEGKIIPENAMIFIGDESYFLETINPGEFQFKIAKPAEDVSFHLQANDVSSMDYKLKVVKVPSISNFEMHLNFPQYLNKKPQTIIGNGNAVIPEGTKILWKIATQSTQNVDWVNENFTFPFVKSENAFVLSKSIIQNTEYQIITSNQRVKNHERLSYQLSVIKDQYPTINVTSIPDSLKAERPYVLGQISDDYGLSKLQVTYYKKGNPQNSTRGIIAIKSPINDQFIFSFPGSLPVEDGVSYEYYFEVFDNDAPHHFKSTKSSVYFSRIATEEEVENQVLQQQNDNLNSLEKSLQKQDKQFSEMDKLQKAGKQKNTLEFNDQQKVNEFLMNQKQQEELMMNYSKKLSDNLEKFNTDKKDDFKEELQKRLEKTNKEMEKNQKLLDELKELNDKIRKEEFSEKLEKYKENSKNQQKSLEQLVELTKRYYVEKKAEQITEKLDKLSQKQEQLSEKDKENTDAKQEEINKSFDSIQEDLNELDKENSELKSPMEIPNSKETEKSIDEDLNKALQELQKNSTASAKAKQKNASKKMKELSKKMEQSLDAAEAEQMEEDVKALRQILDNLLAFSLEQEEIMVQFKTLKIGSPAYDKNIKIQQNLKLQFKHVDDSLFAMSLRNPKIAEDITKEIGNIQYNIDKSLETLSAARIPKGVSHQQYSVSSANKLADLLSNMLNSMQMSMSGSGSSKPKPGSGSGMQLPDIIRKQESLSDKMKEGLKKEQRPRDGKSGEKDQDGKSDKSEGKNGEDGEGDAKAIMEIYKEQQQLREALQNELNKKGLGGAGQNTLEQMKQLEKQLLNKGFKNEVLQKMNNIKQDLLKLDTAIQQQGQDSKRESETNKKEFNGSVNTLPPAVLDYLNSIEILNRQSLPLRSNFNDKVQKYFNKK